MAIDSSVRWFHSEQAGAPQIMAQPGDLIAILDACLLNGFGSKSVDDVVVSGEVATVTISSGHDFEKWAVIRIEGATPGELDGDWRVTSATGSSLTFDCPGIADVTATGTITISRATPGHWEKAFSDTHKAAYRSTHADSSGYYLRIDDSAAGIGAIPVRGYRGMTDIDTGTAPFPPVSEVPEYSWRRAASTNGSNLPVDWAVVVDGKSIWMLIRWSYWSNRQGYAAVYAFGVRGAVGVNGDPMSFIVAHETHSHYDSEKSLRFYKWDGTASEGCWVSHDNAYGSPKRFGVSASGVSDLTFADFSFPAMLSGGYLFHAPVLITVDDQVRSSLPGVLQGMTDESATLPAGRAVRVVVEPTINSPAILLVSCIRHGMYRGYMSFDLEGPW